MKKIPIKLIENHDEAYYFWKTLGISKRPLIHLDAHVDFNFHAVKPPGQAIEEAKSKEALIKQLSCNLFYKKMNIKKKSLTNIGNYVYPAMRDGIINDFYWVIPGDRQEFKKSLKNLRSIIRSFFTRDPFETKKITKERGALKARVYGRNFVITTLEDLPENIKSPFLDIDTDYLTTDTVRKAGSAEEIGKRFPWIWPDELINRLKKKKIKPSCITIAYSVNGGFTPLVYKFLGDEIATFFCGVGDEVKDILLAQRRALVFFKRGKLREATCILKEVLQKLDIVKMDAMLKNKSRAHCAFILFRCFARLGNLSESKFYYNLAGASDKKYGVRDNNYGPLYLRRRRGTRSAEKEFKAILSADRNNPWALSGMGNIFIRRRDFKKAKMFFKKAYSINKKNREALFGLSQTELRLKNYKKALSYLSAYRVKSRAESAAYVFSAEAYEGLGRFNEALEEYKIASNFGVNLNLYLSLFRLLGKRGVPEEHSDWIKKGIKNYTDYKKNFYKSEKKRLRRSRQTPSKRIRRDINRLDNMLEKLEIKL